MDDLGEKMVDLGEKMVDLEKKMVDLEKKIVDLQEHMACRVREIQRRVKKMSDTMEQMAFLRSELLVKMDSLTEKMDQLHNIMNPKFTLFWKLPLELQYEIWRLSSHHYPPRVFEICILEICVSDCSLESNSKSLQLHLPALHQVSLRDMVVYKPTLHPPPAILLVDKASRFEISKTFQKIAFSNAVIRMRMDVDTIYFPSNIHNINFGSPSLHIKIQDPIFRQLQNLALGVGQFVECYTSHDEEYDTSDPQDWEVTNKCSWGLLELQQFPCLKHFTIVLQDDENDRDVEELPFFLRESENDENDCKSYESAPAGSGAITLGDFEKLADGSWEIYADHRKHSRIDTIKNNLGILKEMWGMVRRRQPHWNMPALHFKCLIRNGVVVNFPRDPRFSLDNMNDVMITHIMVNWDIFATLMQKEIDAGGVSTDRAEE